MDPNACIACHVSSILHAACVLGGNGCIHVFQHSDQCLFTRAPVSSGSMPAFYLNWAAPRLAVDPFACSTCFISSINAAAQQAGSTVVPDTKRNRQAACVCKLCAAF